MYKLKNPDSVKASSKRQAEKRKTTKEWWGQMKDLSDSPYKINPRQCIAARALLNWTQKDLAERASLSQSVLATFEGNEKSREAMKFYQSVSEESALSIQRALELGGVVFQSANAKHGFGVRLRAAI
jgi:ribosome-binding protein aMBF1 (putative translation factor)